MVLYRGNITSLIFALEYHEILVSFHSFQNKEIYYLSFCLKQLRYTLVHKRTSCSLYLVLNLLDVLTVNIVHFSML